MQKICKICKILLHIIVTYSKENMIPKLQKLYSLPRNPGASNKSPVLFVKKPLCMGNLSPARKILGQKDPIPYFRQKDPIKVLILTLSSALLKIYRISIFFQTTSQFFSSKFAQLFSVMKDNSSALLQLKQYIVQSQGAN